MGTQQSLACVLAILPGSAAFLQGFRAHRSHSTEAAQKQTGFRVSQSNLKQGRERYEGWVSCLTDQVAQDPMGAAGWIRRVCSCVSTSYAASTRTCHSGQANCGAKEPAQPCVALTNSFLAWKHGDPWSHRGCKPPKQQIEPNVNFLSRVPPPAKELERSWQE